MARIRAIKPDFWQDYRTAQDLSRDQRLFYIGLWNEADDEGRFLAHPRRLLGAIFPYERDLSESFVIDSLSVLAATGRLVLYTVGNEPYGQLTKFAKHQRINRPSPSRIPAPPKDLPDPAEQSLSIHGMVTDRSPGEQGTGKGKGEGKERKQTRASAVADSDDGFSEFWTAYPKRAGNARKKDAGRCWRTRIKEGVDAQLMIRAAVRYARFCSETGKAGTEHVMQAPTFLNDPDNFDNAWKAGAPKARYPNVSAGSQASAFLGARTDDIGKAQQERERERAIAETDARIRAWESAHPDEAKELHRECFKGTGNDAIKRAAARGVYRTRVLERAA